MTPSELKLMSKMHSAANVPFGSLGELGLRADADDMTPNKRLREKVARGIAERALCADIWRDYLDEADIAIRIVIDEVRERISDLDVNP